MLERCDEVRDILDSTVLVLVPVIHFLEDVALVLFELADRVGLDLLDLVTLSLQFGVELFDELALLFKSLLLFEQDGFFDLG